MEFWKVYREDIESLISISPERYHHVYGSGNGRFVELFLKTKDDYFFVGCNTENNEWGWMPKTYNGGYSSYDYYIQEEGYSYSGDIKTLIRRKKLKKLIIKKGK